MRKSAIFALLVALGAGTAQAHHSFAMFDREHPITLKGTVKDFQWTNPHSWIDLEVPDQAGKAVVWGVELGSPSALLRGGMRPTSLKPGDQVTLVVNPLKNGQKGGSLVSATNAAGAPIGRPSGP